jgi:hypothetical protein
MVRPGQLGGEPRILLSGSTQGYRMAGAALSGQYRGNTAARSGRVAFLHGEGPN